MAKKTVVRKKKKVLAIPKGYNNVTPYLIVNNAAKAIEFYKKAFGAKQKMRMDHPGGRVAHAELQIGDTKIMLADECPEMHAMGPKNYGGSAITIHLYVKNVDAIIKKALSAHAKLIRPIQNMFYGDRAGTIEDPHGHVWYVATHVENVTPREMRKRAASLFSK